jgi:DNA-binding transcriptional MerR regulator
METIGVMTISELARKVRLRPSAIRYYEAHGVMDPPPRGDNEYRLYGADAVVTLIFVRRARELGLSLDEIRQIITKSRSESPCALSRELIERHITQIEGEVRRLRKLQQRLKEILADPPPPSGSGICPLIEAAENIS